MKQKRTNIFLAVLALLLSLSLTACGGDADSTSNSNSEDDLASYPYYLSEDYFQLYEGFWVGDRDNQYCINFEYNGNWQLYLDGELVDEGYLVYEEALGTDYAYSSWDDTGCPIEIQGAQLYMDFYGYFDYYQGEGSPTNSSGGGNRTSNNSGDISDYAGLWAYTEENLWLRINYDYTWETLNDQADTIESGTLWMESNGITLYVDGSGNTMFFTLSSSGDLIETETNCILVSVEGIQTSASYFTRNGLTINAEVNAGHFLLKKGVCSYDAETGDAYFLGDCYWEVKITSDKTSKGTRELFFDAICYIPKSSIGSFSGKYSYSTRSQLYDYYTGMRFIGSGTSGSTDRGDNYYTYSVEQNGQSGTLKFNYSTEWKKNVDGWSKMLIKSYAVYMPSWYDGLVFSGEQMPSTYKKKVEHAKIDKSELYVMDNSANDPYSSLYFRIDA